MAVAFALAAFFWLGKSVGAFAKLFAVYAAPDGLFSLIGASRGGGLAERSGLALAALASLVAGAAAGLLPDVTSANLATIIGGWAIARGAWTSSVRSRSGRSWGAIGRWR